MSLIIGKKGSNSFYAEKNDPYRFYEQKAIGVGNYFWDSLIADIESLSLFAGIHAREYDVYRMLSKRFPYAIYYGCLEKLGFSFKVKACEKFYRRHIVDIPRIKF